MTAIRGQIVFAFAAVCAISVSLGTIAVHDLRRNGIMVDRTFDKSLMSINYARAAAADFNAIQAAFARCVSSKDPIAAAAMEARIVTLEAVMKDDLAVAVERAQSERARSAAALVEQAVAAWTTARSRLPGHEDPQAVWHVLDHEAAVVANQLDLLINYMAGDGFAIRQAAHRSIQYDTRFVMVAVATAVIFFALIAKLLSRRIVGMIGAASDVARRIAGGELDTVVPVHGSDELGRMLASMEVMRLSIKSSLDHQVAMRESAQTRLADALQGSREGVIVVDKSAAIVLANAQASLLLAPVCDSLAVGLTARPLIDRIAALPGNMIDVTDVSTTREIELAGGRWLRVSHNVTGDGGSIIICGDITLVKAQETALKASNLWLDAALSNLSQGLCLFDKSQRLKVFNQRFCEMFAIPEGRVQQGMLLTDVAAMAFDGIEDESARRGFVSVLAARRRRSTDELATLASGRKIAMAHRPLADESWLVTFEDVTDRLAAEARIAFMARHDALTGLPNRALFAERVETALAAAARGETFAVLCLDLDHFKQVNDTLGHPFGDELLRVVADCLGGCIREGDMVARLGGDEFAIVQTNVAGPEDAATLAQRVLDVLKSPFDIDGNRVTVGVSIGISLAPGDGSSYGKLLKNADVALYKAKADGRNIWRFFESEMDERLQARRLLEIDLREALEGEQFALHYQPLYEIATDRFSGAEALIRWRHPQRGLVSPAEFIPLAEEIGLITRIGNWVLETACRDAARWPNGATVSVNVSAAQLREGELVRRVIAALYKSGLEPHRLDLEITESVLLAHTNSTLLALNQIRELGVKISMDDFGTGYSALSYLRRFPFDKVKIDRSFISDVSSKSEARAIVRTIIALCRDLGMRTTAEGVESEEQLKFLRSVDCDQAQGFYFSEAVSAPRLAACLSHSPSEIAPPLARRA